MITMSKVHDLLLNLCTSAKKEILLVAPFIKESVLSYLVNHIDIDVKLTCVTRWRPEEIISGVSDIEVYDLLKKIKNGNLFLYPWLHAKYYRGDGQVLVGSMNLTQRAIGFSAPTNFEILVYVDPSSSELNDFEDKLFYSAVEVDDYLFNSMKLAIEQLKSIEFKPIIYQVNNKTESFTDPHRWIPWCPAPDRLYNVYANINTWQLVTSAEKDARRDLSILNMPQGLDLNSFEKFVASTLDQMPLINRIDRKSISGISDQEAETILTQRANLVHSSEVHWRIVKSWLIHFFPERYRRRTETEVLVRSRII